MDSLFTKPPSPFFFSSYLPFFAFNSSVYIHYHHWRTEMFQLKKWNILPQLLHWLYSYNNNIRNVFCGKIHQKSISYFHHRVHTWHMLPLELSRSVISCHYYTDCLQTIIKRSRKSGKLPSWNNQDYSLFLFSLIYSSWKTCLPPIECLINIISDLVRHEHRIINFMQFISFSHTPSMQLGWMSQLN